MIEIKGLCKAYGSHKILKGINVRLRAGVITGIAGPNACGKTTLVKSILGLVVPDDGEIIVLGKQTRKCINYRRAIGYMPQLPDFPSNLLLKELFEMLEDLRGESAPRKEQLIRQFELYNALNQPFGELSGGTKQKVAAIIAFMFDPQVVILDEPTAGLDPLSAIKFKELLRSAVHEERCIVMVSHIMTEINQLASDLVFMLDGHIAFSGQLSELKHITEQEDLENAIKAIAERYKVR